MSLSQAGRPARHRLPRAESTSDFWAAAQLLRSGDVHPFTRHARPASARYAVHVGRVGALAVSLGIGIAIANAATGVAAAESTASAESADTTAAGSGTPDGEQSEESSSDDDADSDSDEDSDDESDDDDVVADDATDDGGEKPTDEGGEDATPDSDDATDEGATDEGDEDATDDGGDEQGADRDEDLAIAGPDTSAGETLSDDVADGGQVGGGSHAPATSQRQLVSIQSDRAPVEETAPATVLAAVVSNAVAPLVDPDLPAPSPLADTILAYLRRVITHTFFNKTPVVRSVETEQILTGQVVITIDAVDPNGDPLTYEIVQPDSGLVFRNPLDGTFIYTPTLPVFGDPVPVQFDIVIRDDSEHLPGALGTVQNILHSIARIFGLAQRDNVTQTVSFEAQPIVQTPPTLAVVGGLPHLVGGGPTPVLVVATIVDLDSPSMKEATVTISGGRQDGDQLRYVAPDGVTIGVEQINDYTLRFDGVASQADYEAALKAITFSTTAGALIGARTIEFTVVDEDGLPNLIPATAALVVSALPLDTPPTLVAIGGGPYFLGDDPVRLLSVTEIIDPDSASLTRAVVTLTGLTRAAGDQLRYVAPDGITIVGSQVNDWTIELTGLASKADYETAFKAITFSAQQLGLVARTIEVTLTDSEDVDSVVPALAALTVLPAITLEPPLLVTPLGLPVHTIGKAPVKLLSSVSIANADNGQLTEAVVTIGLGRTDGDKLGYVAVAGNPVVVTQTNDWTLVLSGTATTDQYQEALAAITFSATQLGLPRTVTISVTEADGDTSPVPGVVFANSLLPLRPTILTPNLPAIHTLGKPGTALTPLVVIEDVDSAQLAGATVALGVGRQAGDTLSYTPPPGGAISASWNGVDTLTLSGPASVDEYEAALAAVTFTASGGVGILRTVTVNVVDDSGLNALVPGVATVTTKAPDRPTLVTLGLTALEFPRVGATVRPITLATIVDLDSTVLTGASVRITDRYTTGDTLAYTPIAGIPITAAYSADTGQLTLSGIATVGQYKQALEAVTFKATRYGGGLLDVLGVTRTLSVYVTDDSNLTNVLPGVVTVTVFR